MKPVVDNRRIKESGFTLVELAVSLLIIGMVMVPALALYVQYAENQRIVQTKNAVKNTNKEIGGFMALYGRYPCPADPTLAPTDPDYGYEEPTCNGGGVVEANSLRPLDATFTDDRIWIGAVPFRQLNLDENDAVDGYGNRLMYAVTASLTDDTTFEPNIGGISILDNSNQSAIDPPDTAHYFLISFNKNSAGAYGIDGIQGLACPVGTRETENCDNDSIFRTGGKMTDFDDLTAFSTPLSISEWQFAAPPNDEHLVLRRAIKFALGMNETEGLGGSSDIEVRAKGTDDGTMLVTAGRFELNNEICDHDNNNCIQPQLIAGAGGPGSGQGMYCADYGGGFIVGVEGSGLRCETEIWMNCPAGSFLVGFDADKKIICDTVPQPGCGLDSATGYCGDTGPLLASTDGTYRYVYSGACYRFATPLDTAAINAAPDTATIQALVATMNDATRNVTSCNQVRDTFQCNSGVWSGTLNAVERLHSSTFNGWGPLYSSTPAPVENSGGAYVTADPMAVDPGNTAATHDCWCREDYRVLLGTCAGAGATGNTVRIQRHRCPQTDHYYWDTIYTNNTSWCGCAPTTQDQTTACYSYFGVASGSLTGNVIRTYDVTCPGSVLVGPTATDVSDCECPARSTSITTSPCPLGTTNNYTYDGNPYTDVNRVYYNTWSCPGGPAPQPATSAADAGSWSGPVLMHTETCSCDAGLTKNELRACPSGYQGAGITYEVEWDCGIPGWEPEANWTQISYDCSQCTWQKPTGAPTIAGSSDALGYLIGGAGCSCGQTDMCRESAGGGLWDVYTNCQCTSN